MKRKQAEFIYAFRHAPILYPITLMYLASVATILLVSSGHVEVGRGIAGLGFVAVMIVLSVMDYQLNDATAKIANVRYLIDGNHDEMADRIDQLMQTLVQHEVPVPPDPNAPHTETEKRIDGSTRERE